MLDFTFHFAFAFIDLKGFFFFFVTPEHISGWREGRASIKPSKEHSPALHSLQGTLCLLLFAVEGFVEESGLQDEWN